MNESEGAGSEQGKSEWRRRVENEPPSPVGGRNRSDDEGDDVCEANEGRKTGASGESEANESVETITSTRGEAGRHRGGVG